MNYPFIRWHKKGRATIRGHGMNEDVGYIAGDKPPNYAVPALPMTTTIHRCFMCIRTHIKTDSEEYLLGSWYPNLWD